MKDKDKKHNNEEPEIKAGKGDKGDEKNKQDEKSKKEDLKQLEDLQSKIEILELETTAYKDKLLRKAAEFENYKRRTENDQLNLIKYGAEGFIRRLLPVIDDFERSLSHIESATDTNTIKEGIKLVYDKFIKILNDQGVSRIEAVGKKFDVHYHEALLQRKDDNVEPHTVLDELEKGYTYNDKVIRHSKVVVSEDTGHEEQDDASNMSNSGEQEN